MGTNQIFMIILSVIIIGIAVTVGIGMFNQYAENSNRNALISDLNKIAGHAMAFYKAPNSLAGGAGHWIPFKDGNVDKTRGDALGMWLGKENYTESASGDRFETENGVFWMNLDSWTSDDLIIIASGNEKGRNSNFTSQGHGDTGCIEVKMIIDGSTGERTLQILN